MKKNKECNIVQDLLPNYIESMTSEITNQYITEHFETCTECKNVFNNMSKEFKLNTNTNNNREVRYLKKVRSKITILKRALLIVGIFAIVFIVNTAYKYSILGKMYDKNVEYDVGNNYHMTILQGNGQEQHIYYKDGVGKFVVPGSDACIWTNEEEAYMVLNKEQKYLPLEKGVPRNNN